MCVCVFVCVFGCVCVCVSVCVFLTSSLVVYISGKKTLMVSDDKWTFIGANPAFQEALGDTIWVASRAVDELLKAGLVDQPGDLQELRINQLMFSALRTIPFVFFAYAYEKWTFDFFDDVIGDDKLNEHWWNLVKKFQVYRYNNLILIVFLTYQPEVTPVFSEFLSCKI